MSLLDTATMLGEVGVGTVGDGSSQKLRMGKQRELITSQAHGRFYESVSRGRVFMAQAIVTAPVIWTTEAGTGGPLLWNGSSTVNVSILGIGLSITTASGVSAAIGLTGGGGQPAAPTTATAIDSTGNLLVGGAGSAATAYRIGTTLDNKWFLPLGQVHTGAVTVSRVDMLWIPLESLVVCPPNSFVSIAASATLTSAVMQLALVWEEIPV